MRNTKYVLGFLVLSLSFAACNKNESSSIEPTPVSEKAQTESLTIEPGTYEVTPACEDKEKTAFLPKVNMVFNFKEDGTYTESIKSLDYTCLSRNGCEALFEGNYKSTKTTFTFENSVLAVNDGSYAKVVVETQDFSILEYVPEKGSLVLVNEQPENACDGKLTWTLVKQSTES